MQALYLDYAATTPVDPRVIEVMQGHLGIEGCFGNPASRAHGYGWQAEAAVETARGQVADLLGADPREIVWTSGATESNNLALKGALAGLRWQHGQALDQAGARGHVITAQTEHKAVLDVCAWLETQGYEVSYLAPDAAGRVGLTQVQQARRDDTVLVSLMHVNNETGVINDIAPVGRWCREQGILFHVDAAQSAGKCALNVADLNVDLMSLSAHKFYGPKGVGLLYVRRATEVQLVAQIHGGGHERAMRSGTLPTHQVVGMGTAAELAQTERESEQKKLAAFKTRFWGAIKNLPGLRLTGDLQYQVPNTINVSFGGRDGEQVLLALRGLAVSSGSACTSASVEPSHVLTAMGLDRLTADSAIRFSFGRWTTEADIDNAIEVVESAVKQLKL